ncbi:hypothetical protein MVEN_00880000 [Mycena venus]|uniref:Uncharacterized protein n=1 Tax=Mycena venus TaxID=2733690 RepID=A0A8H6YGJ2_9AGAR|nr:hypothetical protein MVEN_00880000 [Mycena venus]
MSPPATTNEAKHTADSPRVHPPTSDRPARGVIRFDKGTKPVPRPCPSAAQLYGVITDALHPLFEYDADTSESVIAGVQWSRAGNLILHPAEELCTPKLLASHGSVIWSAIRPLLRIPGSEDRKCPAFDTDDKWHSVVFHGVPVPSPKVDAWTVFTRDRIEQWVTSPTSCGTLRECSILCRPDNIEKKNSLTLRLSFSSAADADRLVKKGGYIFGVPCRVSRYASRLHASSPAPS